MYKKNLRLFILLTLFLGHTRLFAQGTSSVKFGKITAADFDLSSQKIDSDAAAVVIADIGHSEFIGNGKNWLSLHFNRYRRVKILRRTGLDAAQVQIPLFSAGNSQEMIQDLKAVTYNLENGKVVATRLDDNSVFTEKISANLVAKKFAFPAVKEGSIIEYSFNLVSDFMFNLQPWEFQGPYPCLYSEYEAEIPNFFKYVRLSQGYLPMKETSSSRRVTFQVLTNTGRRSTLNTSPDFYLNDEVVDHHWSMKNVPALKEEKFTTTLKNHIAKIEFQLSQYNFPGSLPTDKLATWSNISEQLLKGDAFGADLDRNNGWMDDAMKNITRSARTPLEKAKKIYAFLQDSFTCKFLYYMFPDNTIKTVFKTRSGNAAAINLLLVAMLKHENITADPIILSTRSNGVTNETYPMINRFNYVICAATIDSTMYTLDASRSWMGFGHLPEDCYNGHSRIVNKESPDPVYFEADSVRENKMTTVFISNDEKEGLVGGVQIVPGYFESCQVREKIHKDGEKEFFKAIQSSYAGSIEISNTGIDSLKLLEEPVKISYDFTLHFDNSDIVYFNPLVAGDAYKENPFRSAERTYPVEMPSAFDKVYVLNMEIPAGYKVEELPASAKVSYNGDEGFFEYIVVGDESNIQIRTRIQMNKANFKPEEYNTLRDFYALVVKKQNEQIVFKKKK